MAEPKAIETEGAPERALDEHLVHGLRADAPGAAAELCERFGPKLHRCATAWLRRDGQAAEEVVVDALIDAVRSIARFDPRRSSLAPWLYGIVRRKVVDELRRQHRRRSVPAPAQASLETLAEAPSADDTAEAAFSRIVAQRQVAALAAALSGIEFEVLVLSAVEEFTAPEIGRIVGRSGRAVHSILHRARRKARERLADRG